ncbi:GDP-fucose protein O-fucosyltransferase [Cinnamomum micranthum f. kanehirae]|uniref:O-fucosyltransferase family protein n=1 Tax=Cinnamomum micranthum f. kanehirae TaxID=337451 RepID=A0A3S3NHP5_9MAGN|nr:GDP-fucose protein O-fucosyltransferase [Cinnamomum micranthum f. kanehirae]
MQRRRLRPGFMCRLSLLRLLLACALGTIVLAALLASHVFPSPKVHLPKHEIGYQRWKGELSWMREFSPPQLSRAPLPSKELVAANNKREIESLWKPPPSRGFVPCIEPSDSYLPPTESQGYLLVHTNGGLNQMRAGICDMVAVARIINATLVIPELDKRSFWQDSSNFSDVFDVEHFISALANDVKVIKKLPKELATTTKAVKHFRSWSGVDYYQDEISRLWEDYEIIRAAKSDSRLANNNMPPDIQKLRCRALYEALRFSPRIETLGKLLVERMRSYGRYIALHLRYEKDMLAFSGCTYGLSPAEADELTKIRENTAYWKVKDIDSMEQRAKGYCPLTPKEVGIFLSALGYPSNTPIYIAAGEIYGGNSRIADLESRFPILMNKEKLASADELEPFMSHASQMAALDYIVSVESDVFVPSYSGNMARAVEGHRRFLGHRKTISPDRQDHAIFSDLLYLFFTRKALVHLFDKIDWGSLKEGKKLSDLVIEIHKKRQGSPRRRKGPISGTKGKERFRSEESFYENPLPDCLCREELPSKNSLANA